MLPISQEVLTLEIKFSRPIVQKLLSNRVELSFSKETRKLFAGYGSYGSA